MRTSECDTANFGTLRPGSARMQAMSDRVVKSLGDSYSPPLKTRGMAAFLPGSIFFGLCIRKDSAMTPALRYLPALATLLLAFLVVGVLPPVALATCTAPKNPIEAENCLPGTPASQWYVDGAGSSNIQGFTTDISVNTGQTIFFKISTSAVSYRIDIYRRTHGRNSISATYWLVLLATSRSSSPLSERTLRAPGIRSRLTTSSNRIERYGEDAASLRMWKCQERTS